MNHLYNKFDLERLASDDELKASLLSMLLSFDQFCQKHGLTYYLSGGTLLGAVRHKGFIPWDDDIDINMPRPDCEKLMSLSGGAIGNFKLIPPNNLKNTFAYHWKLYDDKVLVSKRVERKSIGKKIYPTFVDIFPIEGLSDTYEESVQHYEEIKKIKRKARFQAFAPRYRGFNPVKKLTYLLARVYFRFFGLTNFHEKVISCAKKYPYERANYVGVMMTDVHGIEERVLKSEYSPLIEMEFEGNSVKCPAGFHKYLDQLYGPTYMDILPPHKQFSRHNLVSFIRKKVGTIDEILLEESLLEDDENDNTAAEMPA